MRNKIYYPALLSIIVIAACGNGKNQNSTDKTDTVTSNTSLGMARDSKDSQTDTADLEFLKNAAIGGMAEVEASSRMLIISTDPAVKKFAQMMIDDHTKAGAELKALAEKKGVQLSSVLPGNIIEQIKNIDKFKNDGRNEYYANMMVQDHQKTIDLFNKAASSSDKFIADFARSALPVLEHHFKMAKELEAKLTEHKKNQGDDPLKLSDQKK